MIFHYPQRKIENLIPDLKYNSQTIKRVSEFNFLGLTIEECLSWKPHVQKVSNKVSCTIGILRRLKNFLPAHVLRTLYNTLILPHFHYSIAVWGFKMGWLKRLQKRAMWVITCSNYNAHTEPLLKKLNLLSLSDILILNILKTYYNLIKWQTSCLCHKYVLNFFSCSCTWYSSRHDPWWAALTNGWWGALHPSSSP